MRKENRIKKKMLHLVMIIASAVMLGVVVESEADSSAKSRVRLSFTKKVVYYLDSEVRLSLKGISPRAQIKWRTSNSSIAQVLFCRKSYAWIGIRAEGNAVITATYRGRKYKARISVSGMTCQEPVCENDETTDGNGATETTPVEESTGMSTEGTEAAPAAEETPRYEQVMIDFENRFISADMSEYQKVEAICRFVAGFQYEAGQSSWTQMLETGRGDCYSSRIVVMMLCRRIGLKATGCMSFDCHGETIVKADGVIYMTTTGFSDDYYRILEMDEESFLRKISENHISKEYFE